MAILFFISISPFRNKNIAVRNYIKKVDASIEKPDKLLSEIQRKEGKKKIEGTI